MRQKIASVTISASQGKLIAIKLKNGEILKFPSIQVSPILNGILYLKLNSTRLIPWANIEYIDFPKTRIQTTI